ncbi:thioredoxin [Candidatus Methanomethylophilus sp. 1R26]|jgi:thioredoxin 1|uniref:thioredoxin n=1 Tax=Candidatus Methanomethylophilus sp. 1R26 TaxID=1769296 RepID=UPI000736A06D|nr:thioredoxin [Candidatus Methanomethylophilus sp. 1R26]MCH3977581.1 thioredoxin [Methanomethylophilus sp.]WII08474.1 thioredoxin [Methanomassiliicoccales archaeon LGM-DZ1]KUE74329.1 thioredoxin [Candidatus Methanomethylophilus sp. 1R26]MCI2075045.1 thioredoxin [Methanomethylophilus sp.]MCI2092387.1 thioredoxin [Methanomethylophilus sp.]
MVTELNEQTFSTFVKQDGVVLVDCWAPWCGPCRRMGPIIDQLSEELPDVKVGKLNTDENQAVARTFGISAIPTLLFFVDGVQQESLIGLRPKEDIVSYIDGLKKQ